MSPVPRFHSRRASVYREKMLPSAIMKYSCVSSHLYTAANGAQASRIGYYSFALHSNRVLSRACEKLLHLASHETRYLPMILSADPKSTKSTKSQTLGELIPNVCDFVDFGIEVTIVTSKCVITFLPFPWKMHCDNLRQRLSMKPIIITFIKIIKFSTVFLQWLNSSQL